MVRPRTRASPARAARAAFA